MNGITLSWDLPAGTTQYQIQIIPFNGDGPGINLIRNAESQFTIPAPPTWYILLPGMSYSWRLRATDKATSASEGDPSWGPWSDTWSFRTPSPSADSVHPSDPPLGATATSLTPTLVWSNDSSAVFYYEIQVSQDSLFDTNPNTAIAAVYWNLVHGGQTQPLNSWAVPTNYPPQQGCRYYWRVRPRVQGDGAPVNWPLAYWFMAPSRPAEVCHTQAATTTPTATPTAGPTVTTTATPTVAPTVAPTATAGPTVTPPSSYTLTVTVATDQGATGGGTVTSFPVGITDPDIIR